MSSSSTELKVTITVEDFGSMVKPEFKRLFVEFLCALLDTDDPAVARDWLIAKVAQSRGSPESDVAYWFDQEGF